MENNRPKTKENIIYYYFNVKTQPMTKYFSHLVVFKTSVLRGFGVFGVTQSTSQSLQRLETYLSLYKVP
jgi:hypothetical protein